MNQQESNYIPFTSNQELATPMDLLLNEEWLRKSIQAEEEVGVIPGFLTSEKNH